MQTVVETPVFIRRAEKLLDESEHSELIAFLASHPLEGDEIVGTGGVRKLRFAALGKGKSGGVRVIYYFHPDLPIVDLWKKRAGGPDPGATQGRRGFSRRRSRRQGNGNEQAR